MTEDPSPEPIPWRERILVAQTRRYFSVEDIKDSRSFRTCAVSEYRETLPLVVRYRRVEGRGPVPVDPRLDDLGCAFHLMIISNNPAAALSVLDAIDDRVLQLKRLTQWPMVGREPVHV